MATRMSSERGTGNQPRQQQENGHPTALRASTDAPGIFTVDDRQVRFYILTSERHRSFGLSEGAVASLRGKITGNGGEVVPSEESNPDTIIVGMAGLEVYRDKYFLSRRTYVEPPQFVHTCILRREYKHRSLQKTGMGGRIDPSSRQPFTQDEDDYLCKFLAQVIPDKAAGGRTGNNIYKELCTSELSEFQWAKTHSWQSWRERYKCNQERLDPIIDEYVKEEPPQPDGKGQYYLDRRYNRRARLFLRQHGRRPDQPQETHANEEEEEEEEEDEVVEVVSQERRRRYNEVESEDESVEHGRHDRGHARKRPRHTDMGPQRTLSSDRGRTARRTHSDAHLAARRQEAQGEEQFDGDGLPTQEVENDSLSFDHSGRQAPNFNFDGELAQEDHYLRDRRPGPEDAGPSGTQRTPAPTARSTPQAAPPAKRRPGPRFVGRARSPAPFMSSQVTLVGPVAQTQKPLDNLVAGATEHLTALAPAFPMSSQATLVGPVPTQLRSTQALANEPVQRQPLQPSRTNDAEASATLPSSATSQLTPKKAARKTTGGKRIRVLGDPRFRQDLPLHNTRARSRSRPPEPIVEIQSRRNATRRGRTAEPEPVSEERDEPPQMEAVPEEIELVEVIPDSENERAHLEMLQESAAPAMEAAPPAGETYEDEADVEGMLAVAESAPQSGARSVVTQPSPAVRHSPQDELDSDDQRVERSLFVSPSVHSSARRVPHSTSGIVQRGLSDDAADAADELNQSMMANLSDHSFAHLPRLSLSGQPHPSASADRSHRRVSAPIAPSASGLLQHTAPTSPASRPSPAGHIPEDSSNSEFETVPMLGTRARAEKQRLKEETLRREWTPPPGTRASRMVTRSGAVFGRR